MYICIVNTSGFNSGLVKNHQTTAVSHLFSIYGDTLLTFLHFLSNSWKALWVLYSVPLFTLRKLKWRKVMQIVHGYITPVCLTIYLCGPNTLSSLLSSYVCWLPSAPGLGSLQGLVYLEQSTRSCVIVTALPEKGGEEVRRVALSPSQL